MKWISRGTVLAITPYTLFFVIPYLLGTMTTPAITTAMKISVLSLAFLPLTFGYAIVRYRLMTWTLSSNAALLIRWPRLRLSADILSASESWRVRLH